ncbi:hypothetical protein BT63DRAFT_387586, partial [Microthyrium microscopicum]
PDDSTSVHTLHALILPVVAYSIIYLSFCPVILLSRFHLESSYHSPSTYRYCAPNTYTASAFTSIRPDNKPPCGNLGL